MVRFHLLPQCRKGRAEEKGATVQYKQVQCREHGGMFSVPVKRGRPPVRCNPENVCDMAKKPKNGQATAQVAKRTSETLKGKMPVRSKVKPETVAEAAREDAKPKRSTLPKDAGLRTSKWCKCPEQGGERHEKGIEGCRYAAKGAPVIVRHNPSVNLGRLAKEKLTPLGWNVVGRAWFEVDITTEEPSDRIGFAEITATRGTETLVIRWKDGKLENQVYNLWDEEKPSNNGKPRSRLPFDPDETTDPDLIRFISGQKVTWWNRIAGSTEHAIIGEKVQVEHAFVGGTGDEVARIIKFNDKSSGSFRAFHVAALMKVG